MVIQEAADEKIDFTKGKRVFMPDIYTGCTSANEALKGLFYFNRTFFTSACCKIYRANIFRDMQFPKGLYYEDLATIYKIYSGSDRIAFTDEVLYGYRVNMSSIMHKSYSPKMLSCIEIGRQVYSDISEQYPHLSKAAASIAFNINRTVYLNLPHNKKEERRKVWAEIVKYRREVLTDKHARKRERIMALCTYAGAEIFWLISGLFRLYHSKR